MASALALGALLAAPCFRRIRVEYELYRARTALDQGEPALAVPWLESAEALAPDRGDVHYFYGVAYRRTGHVSKALAQFDRAQELGWSRKEILPQRMMAAFQAGKTEESEAYLKRLLDSQPSDAIAEEIYECLARGYMADLRFREASLCLDYWIQWNPKSVIARLWRADICALFGDAEAQRQELREVLKLDPGHLAGRETLGESLLKANQIDAAMAEFKRGLQDDPRNAHLLLGVAYCNFRKGELATAQRQASEALEMTSDRQQRSFGLLVLGQTALEAKDYRLAATRLEEAIELSPHDPIAWYALGTTLAKQGEKDRSKQCIARSEELNELVSRLAAIDSQVAHDPTDAVLRFEAATILTKLGEEDTAARWLLSVVRMEPEFIAAHRALADYYAKHRQPERANHHRKLADRGTKSASPSSKGSQ